MKKKNVFETDSIEERWENYFSSDKFDKLVKSRSGDVTEETIIISETYEGNTSAADKFLTENGF